MEPNKPKPKPRKKLNMKKALRKVIEKRTVTKPSPFQEFGLSGRTRGLNNATQLRSLPRDRLLNQMKIYSSHMKQRYMIGLIHPDLAVQHGLQPKLYHDVPLPTGAFGLYGSYTDQTNSSGNMLISCRTPGQPGTSLPMQNITVNNDPSLTGTATSPYNYFRTVQPILNIATQRYRLVSNLIRVTYQGPLLNISGKYYSSAVYDPFPITYFNTAVQNDGLVDKYGNFGLIKNGLWNTSLNVADGQRSIECLWVPTDGDDYFFQRPFAYFGTAFTSGDALLSPDQEGAHLAYIIGIQGAPASTKFMIEQWSNYEIIADPTTAPYLITNTDVTFTSQDKDNYTKLISNEMQGPGLIRGGTEIEKTNWIDTMAHIAEKGLPIVQKILSLF